MALYKTRGVVIGRRAFGESDRLVDFYTRDHGKVRGIARSARRPRSRFGSALELFTLGEMVFFDSGRSELVQVDHFDIVRSFVGVREHLERLGAHIDVELGIDPDDLSNPWQAALSSAVAFTLGAVVPLIAILLPPVGARVPVTFLSVLIALVLTGTVSAILGGARKRRAVLRVVLGGALAMLVTYGIGQMVGTTM